MRRRGWAAQGVGTPSFSQISSAVEAVNAQPYMASYAAGVQAVLALGGVLSVAGGVVAWIALGRRDPLATVYEHRDERAAAPG